MATIVCRDCGHPRTGVPRNTRYCQRCRQLRDLDYWRRHVRTCPCGSKFAPLGRSDTHCSTCNPGLRSYSGPCVLGLKTGAHEGLYPSPQLPVCAACARDPKQRANLIRALEVGQRKRRAANNHQEASHA